MIHIIVTFHCMRPHFMFLHNVSVSLAIYIKRGQQKEDNMTDSCYGNTCSLTICNLVKMIEVCLNIIAMSIIISHSSILSVHSTIHPFIHCHVYNYIPFIHFIYPFNHPFNKSIHPSIYSFTNLCVI